MLPKRVCDNCGVEFVPPGEADAFCFPCELAIRAVEPPEVLKDLRRVYAGNRAETHGQISLAKLLQENVSQFTDRMIRAEDQYRSACVKWQSALQAKAAVGASVEKWDGKGICSGCGRGPSAAVEVVETSTPKLIEKVQKWIVGQPKGG